MKIMSEKELKAINPKELEGKDIAWQANNGGKQTGRLLFDYYQGFSLTDKDNHDDCLVGIHGPKDNNTRTNYMNKPEYHKKLTISFAMLRKGYFSCTEWNKAMGRFRDSGGNATCSFT